MHNGICKIIVFIITKGGKLYEYNDGTIDKYGYDEPIILKCKFMYYDASVRQTFSRMTKLGKLCVMNKVSIIYLVICSRNVYLKKGL